MNIISTRNTKVVVTYAFSEADEFFTYPWMVGDVAEQVFRQGAVSVSFTRGGETTVYDRETW